MGEVGGRGQEWYVEENRGCGGQGLDLTGFAETASGCQAPTRRLLTLPVTPMTDRLWRPVRNPGSSISEYKSVRFGGAGQWRDKPEQGCLGGIERGTPLSLEEP